ncbi:MAG: protein YgfX [Cycloclasticus sp.]
MSPASLKKSIPAFEIELINPVTRHVVTGFIFLSALICCWLNSLAPAFQLGLSSLLLLSLMYGLKTAAFCHRGLCRIACQPDAYWLLSDAKGAQLDASLLNSSVIIGPFYFLNFATQTGSLSLLLTADSMSDEAARKLRVSLKLYRQQLIAVRL